MRFGLRSFDWINVAFWAILVLITQGAIWLLPFADFVKVDLTWLMLFMNGASVLVLNDTTARSYNYFRWVKMIVVGIVLTALTIAGDGEIRGAFAPLLRLNTERSALNFQNLHGSPANFFMIVGLSIMYGGVVGTTRLAFMRGLRGFSALKLQK